MVDVLLAHSFFLCYDRKQQGKMRPYPPLATLYAAAVLRQAGYSVALFDAMLSNGVEEFEQALAVHRPRYVALYEDSFNFLAKMCLSRMREAALRMISMSRAHGALVLAAGPDVTDQPEIYLRAGASYALLREADWTILETVNALEGRASTPVQSVRGLAYQDHAARSGIRCSAGRSPERRPDSLPLPAWDLVDIQRYRHAWVQTHGYFSLNMASSRGCPYHCNWCAKPIWGQQYAVREPAAVAEEMALLKRTVRPDHIWFADDIFGLRPGWIAQFGREVTSRSAELPFMIQTRADRMTEDAVEGLREAGCIEVWIGAESGSQSILDAMEKGITVEEITAARIRLQAAGIRVGYFLQFGYPGETLSDIQATVNMVREALPDEIGVSVSYPLPGTRFYDRVRGELGAKDRWSESGDLAMMFQGLYQTPFYRRLHALLHRDLEIRLESLKRPDELESCQRLALVDAEWADLFSSEREFRSARPTRLNRPRPAPGDLRTGPSQVSSPHLEGEEVELKGR